MPNSEGNGPDTFDQENNSVSFHSSESVRTSPSHSSHASYSEEAALVEGSFDLDFLDIVEIDSAAALKLVKHDPHSCSLLFTCSDQLLGLPDLATDDLSYDNILAILEIMVAAGGARIARLFETLESVLGLGVISDKAAFTILVFGQEQIFSLFNTPGSIENLVRVAPEAGAYLRSAFLRNKLLFQVSHYFPGARLQQPLAQKPQAFSGPM